MIRCKKLDNLLKKQDVDGFLSQIENAFPNFVAGILCDEHGFTIASKNNKNTEIKENLMALSALTDDREFILDPNIMKVKRELGISKNVKLLVLLEKTNNYIHKFKSLNRILENQELF